MDDDRTVLVNFDDEMSINKAYMELGKAYYEGNFEDPLPQLLPMFDKITRIRKKIESVKPHIETIILEANSKQAETMSFCQNCGARLEVEAIFCGQCGCKVE